MRKLDPVRHFWNLNFTRNLSSRARIGDALNDAQMALADDEALDASEPDDEPHKVVPGVSEAGIRKNEQRLDAVGMLLAQHEIEDMHNLTGFALSVHYEYLLRG